MNIKWKRVSSYYAMSTEGRIRDDFKRGGEELDWGILNF